MIYIDKRRAFIPIMIRGD